MTRIFDALKKAQITRPTAAITPMPAPGVTPMSAGPGAVLGTVGRPGSATIGSAAVPAGFAPLPHVETVVPAPLDEEVARELTMLRIRLDSVFQDRTSRVVMLMSSQGGEGTTTVASEFARLLALEGRQRVLLADMHARRPALAQRFGLGHGHRPLRSGETPELAVLPVDESSMRQGAINPALARQVVASVSNLYDWIVLDGPPALESPEAVEIAALADGVVLVVQSGIAKRPVVSRAADLLRRGGARVLGTVLNRRRLEIPEFIYRRI
jgi:Mrp family chromosome partitioning ATPase